MKHRIPKVEYGWDDITESWYVYVPHQALWTYRDSEDLARSVAHEYAKAYGGEVSIAVEPIQPPRWEEK